MLPQPSLILNATNSPVGLAAMECPVSRFWRGQHSWTLSQCGSYAVMHRLPTKGGRHWQGSRGCMRGASLLKKGLGHIYDLRVRVQSPRAKRHPAPSPVPPEALNQSPPALCPAGAEAVSPSLWVLGSGPVSGDTIPAHKPPPLSSPHKPLQADLPGWLHPFSLGTFHIIPASGPAAGSEK